MLFPGRLVGVLCLALLLGVSEVQKILCAFSLELTEQYNNSYRSFQSLGPQSEIYFIRQVENIRNGFRDFETMGRAEPGNNSERPREPYANLNFNFSNQGEGIICASDAYSKSVYGRVSIKGRYSSKSTNEYEKPSLFYWLFERKEKPERSPLVVWLNGGPGCSSMLGLLGELGPCKFISNSQESTLVANPHTWVNAANILFVDQPFGIGMSVTQESAANSDHIVDNSYDVAKDFYQFLLEFYKIHPEYQKRDLIIAGESYGGHYVPAIASQILTMNDFAQEKDTGIEMVIPLKSILLGNPFVDGIDQLSSVPEVLRSARYGDLISDADYNAFKVALGRCINFAQVLCMKDKNKSRKICGTVTSACWGLSLSYTKSRTGRNIYDIRETCEQGSCSTDKESYRIESYLNSDNVAKELELQAPFSSCNLDVNKRFVMSSDFALSHSRNVTYILNKDIPVLVYAGDADIICNWIGQLEWIRNVKWTNSPDAETKLDDWIDVSTKDVVGKIYDAGILKLYVIYDAGHMVPTNQPEVSYKLFSTWLNAGDYSKPLNFNK